MKVVIVSVTSHFGGDGMKGYNAKAFHSYNQAMHYVDLLIEEMGWYVLDEETDASGTNIVYCESKNGRQWLIVTSVSEVYNKMLEHAYDY